MGNIKSKLRKKSLNNTPKHIFDGNKYYCKVIDVYDGDTITIALNLNGKQIYQYKVRMYGYDSPEMKPRKNIKNRDIIIQNAKIAKNELKRLILHKIVVIKIEKGTWDKYGRLLGTIYMKQGGLTIKSYTFNVNQYMIENNYGYPYFGGTKKI